MGYSRRNYHGRCSNTFHIVTPALARFTFHTPIFLTPGEGASVLNFYLLTLFLKRCSQPNHEVGFFGMHFLAGGLRSEELRAVHFRKLLLPS